MSIFLCHWIGFPVRLSHSKVCMWHLVNVCKCSSTVASQQFIDGVAKRTAQSHPNQPTNKPTPDINGFLSLVPRLTASSPRPPSLGCIILPHGVVPETKSQSAGGFAAAPSSTRLTKSQPEPGGRREQTELLPLL